MKSNQKNETIIGLCVVSLTRHIMEKENAGYEEAFKALLPTTLYKLLMDEETGLLYEPYEYLHKAYDEEVDNGKEAFYEFIRA